MPSLISSEACWPTSLMNIRPVPGWNANVNGLRSPSAQIARLAPWRVEERVVSRDGAVRVDPQHLAEPAVQRLGAPRHRVVADRDVELPVGAEVDRAAVAVVLAAQGIKDPRMTVSLPGMATSPLAMSRLTVWLCNVGRTGGVIHVNIMIDGEVRVHRHAEQPSPWVGVDRKRDERRRQQDPSLTTRRRPPCSQTSSRPSGMNVMAVGPARNATSDSSNPGGSEAACPAPPIAPHANIPVNSTSSGRSSVPDAQM